MGFKQAVGAFCSDNGPLYDAWPGGWDSFISKVNGFQPNLVHWYQTWEGSRAPFSASRMNEAMDTYGATVMISWAPRNTAVTGVNDTNYKLTTITNGSHDVYIRGWAQQARELGRAFLVRPMHEFNYTGIGPWAIGSNGNVLADFMAAWKYLYNLCREEGAWNMNFVWSPLTYGSTAISSAIYPGNEYVDVVALDAYNWNNNSQPTGDYATLFGSYYDTVMSLCGGMKPFMVAEFGCAEGSAVMSKDAWFQDTFDTDMPTRTPKLKYTTYFDADFSTQGEMDWRINSSEAARLSFVDILDDPANIMEPSLGGFPARFVTATMGGSGPASNTVTITRPDVPLDRHRKQILLFKLHNGGAVFAASGQDPHPPAGSGILLVDQMSDNYVDPPANTTTNSAASTIATAFYKTIVGDEPLSWVFNVTLGTATSAWCWSVELWEWVDTANPFDGIAKTYLGDTPASVSRYTNLPLPTTTQADTVVSWLVTTQTTATAPAQAPTPNVVDDPDLVTPATWPDGIIQRYRAVNYVTPGSGTSNARTVFSFDKVMPVPGTVGDFDALSDIATRFVGIGIGIRSGSTPIVFDRERYPPDAFIGAGQNLTGPLSNVQDDPLAPDNLWLTAP